MASGYVPLVQEEDILLLMMFPITQKVLKMKRNDSFTVRSRRAMQGDSIGNGKLELVINGRTVTIYGGPYRNRPAYLPGVKLAQEIDAPCDVDCPIQDFSVPHKVTANIALWKIWKLLERKDAIYVGCMGGWGRTGLMLSLIVKLSRQMRWSDYCAEEVLVVDRLLHKLDPVEHVRTFYSQRAVETEEQFRFVSSFNTRLLSFAIRWL